MWNPIENSVVDVWVYMHPHACAHLHVLQWKFKKTTPCRAIVKVIHHQTKSSSIFSCSILKEGKMTLVL